MEYGFALTKFIINKKDYNVCLRLDESRKMIGIHIDENNNAILNNIYVGRIENIVESIHAYFVRFQDNQTCFLPFEEAMHPIYVHKQSKNDQLAIGDLILVQITREALKEKDPAASCNLTLHGKYMLIASNQKGITFSKKISPEIKERLKQIFDDPIDDYGVIVRTIAREQTDEALKEDCKSLISSYMDILSNSIHKSLYDKVFEEAPSYISFLKNQYNKADFVVTDDKEILDIINKYIPSLSKQIRYYEDSTVSLSTLYNIKGNIDSLLSKKVWLKSGGNIIIEQLETLTLIDVNSAKSDSKKMDAYKINMEALYVALQQITLRNISGMIIIDFINMSFEDQTKLIVELKKLVKEFPNPCRYVDTTKLGLVELTRKKINRSIKEIC